MNNLSSIELTMMQIPDGKLREYIFGKETISKKDISNNAIGNMNNIMIFSFFAVYSLWKRYINYKERYEDDMGFITPSLVHAKRVDDVLKKMYCNNILTQETMAFVFTELLLEIDKNSHSPFYNIVNGQISSAKFSKIAEIIRVWKISYQAAEDDGDILIGLYKYLISTLTILKYMSIDDSDGLIKCTISLPDGKKYQEDLSLFIRKLENDYGDEICYLHKATLKGGKVNLEYINFGGNIIFSNQGNIEKNDFFKFTKNDLGFSRNDDIASSLKINDFKYIYRLALCISDSIGEGTKADILKRIHDRSIYVENYKNKSIIDVNWDNTIVLLMLEDGPSEVIEMVLRSDINAFEKILKSVAIRFNIKNSETKQIITSKELLDQYNKKEARELLYYESMQNGYVRNQRVQTWIKNAKIFLMAQFIISTVAENEAHNVGSYAETIKMKLDRIESFISENGELASLGMINKTLERVFRMLILFYNGLLQYAEKKEEVLKKYDLNQRHFEPALKVIQKECEDAFFKYVEDRLNEERVPGGKTPIRKATLGSLVSEFRELCMSLDSQSSKGREFNKQSNLLNSVIGRRSICSVDLFNNIITSNPDDFDNADNYPKDLVEFFNIVLKHDDPTKNIKDLEIIDNYIDYVKDLFEFLDMNGDYLRRRKKAIQNIFDPIFPYVIRYSEKNENRDRCGVCQYIINMDGAFDDKRIKLLTEYDYKMNELYYCIPNAESSTKNWWVSPFLISCRKFDKLLLQIEGDD